MTANSEHSIPLWRDDRFWKIALQVIAVIAIVAIATLLIYNLSINMQRAGLKFGFDFLDNQASFDILDSVAPYDVGAERYKSIFPYDPTNSYARVLQAGLVNSLMMMISGIILTTIVGIIVGVFQFSDNWLLRKGSELYVEIVRNTPLLLQLLFWYSAVFSQLPRPSDRMGFLGSLYLSKRGIFMPWPTVSPWLWLAMVLWVVGAIVLWLRWDFWCKPFRKPLAQEIWDSVLSQKTPIFICLTAAFTAQAAKVIIPWFVDNIEFGVFFLTMQWGLLALIPLIAVIKVPELFLRFVFNKILNLKRKKLWLLVSEVCWAFLIMGYAVVFLPLQGIEPLLLGTFTLGTIALIALWQWRTHLMTELGKKGEPQFYAFISITVILVLVILFGLGWSFPSELTLDPTQFDARATENFATCAAETYGVENLADPLSEGNLSSYQRCLQTGDFKYGLRLSIEFAALLVGLVIYTAAFIAEIVRAGIQSVAKGQWEAARALGLHSDSTMRLVVFPQALRVIIPPLNSQYQNLAKNSSLGAAIAYAELYNVANTTYNQSGRPIDVMLIIAVTYLAINMVISLTMNTFNRAVQLKER